MKRNLRYLVLVLLMCTSGNLLAQTSGLQGVISTADGEPALGAIVEAFEGGIKKGGAAADYDGNYDIKPLQPGTYVLRVVYSDNTRELTNVTVSPNAVTTVNVKMTILVGVTFSQTRYERPIISDKGDPSIKELSKEEIERMPTYSTADFASTKAGVYQQSTGSGLNLGGARSSGTKYIIDGVQLPPGSSAFTNLPPGSIANMQVLTSGIPAKYGDASGGIINITTNGVTAKPRGGLWLEQSIDGYDNKQASFNLSGPLLKVGDSNNRRPVIGYSVNATTFLYQDNDPSYDRNVYLNDAKRAEIEANPLVVLPATAGNSTLGYSANYVRESDLIKQKRRVNAQEFSARGTGKLDFQVSDNVSIQLGGAHSYGNSDQYSRFNSIFSPQNNTNNQSISNTSRGYLRFSQKLGIADSGSAISNVAYTVQADYQRDDFNSQNREFKHDPFKYGYVGKFVQNRAYLYAPFTDTANRRLWNRSCV